MRTRCACKNTERPQRVDRAAHFLLDVHGMNPATKKCPNSGFVARSHRQEEGMLYYAVVFFIIALIAALLGFGGIAAGAAGIAKILFIVFLIVSIVTFLMSLARK
jgi:uncharacterized membrane protein YtjA (UPF0391 family)